MKKIFFISTIFFSSMVFARSEILNAGRFGKVTIYGAEKTTPLNFIFFLSDKKNRKNAEQMAKDLEDKDSVVVSINTGSYLKNLLRSKEKCHYSAADLESLGHLVQMKLNFKEFVVPTIVGHLSGASLAYGILAQAPANTFRGAFSIDFCPVIQLDKPLCKGNGLLIGPKNRSEFYLRPAPKLKSPWVILQGSLDKSCPLEEQKKFTQGMPNTTLVELNNVGRDLKTTEQWLPQFKEAYSKVLVPEKARSHDPSIADLPLEELPVEQKNDSALVIILSGDGGWASLDKDLAGAFNDLGLSVVGINSLKYFWNAKTEDVIGKDLDRIAQFYTKTWSKKKIIWVGYSMGADALPFGLNRLSNEMKNISLAAVYIGPSKNAEFEFNFTNWLSTGAGDEGRPIGPEVERLSKMSSLKNICIFGAEEKDTGCAVLKDPIKTIEMPGGHHFGGEYDKLAALILKNL